MVLLNKAAQAASNANVELKFSPEMLDEALDVMFQGMVGIFIAIGAIMLFIYAFNWVGNLTKKKKK